MRVCGKIVSRFGRRFGSTFSDFHGPAVVGDNDDASSFDEAETNSTAKGGCAAAFTRWRNNAAPFMEVVLMIEMMTCAVVLAFPLQPQVQVVVTIASEVVVVGFIGAILPFRDPLKNGVHAFTRLVDIALLCYLHGYYLCQPMDESTETAFVTIWTWMPYVHFLPALAAIIKGLVAKFGAPGMRKVRPTTQVVAVRGPSTKQAVTAKHYQ